MATEDAGYTLRDRLSRQGEDALGRLAQELLENPLVTGAISKAFDARERAVQAQETAMSALNLPSAADLERRRTTAARRSRPRSAGSPPRSPSSRAR